MKIPPDQSLRLAAVQESNTKMSWFSELAGKAENILNNIDDRAATALHRNKTDVLYAEAQAWLPRAAQPRRPPRPYKKQQVTETRSSYSPSRKSVPSTRQAIRQFPELKKEVKMPVARKIRKGYDVQQRIDREEDEIREYQSSYRRRSLPNHKEEEMAARATKLEKILLDNQMLKNDVGVCNQEISDLLDKMRILEYHIKEANVKYDNLDKLYKTTKEDKEALFTELTKIKEKSPPEPEFGPEYTDLSSAYRALEKDFASVNDRNRELQSQIKEIEMKKISNSSIQMKLENDLRFAHMTLNDLRADFEKSRNECHRIQSDWDAYKLRVKNMLISKDKEIQALEKGSEHSEGMKMLADQVDSLREEREQLSCALTRAQAECAEASRRVEQVEQRAHGAERLVAALREALREERLARNKAENQCIINNKALKNLQMETSHQIASLNTTVRDKDAQIQKLRSATNRSATSVCPASDTSALNVAECNRAHDTISSEKVQLLTQSLLSKQGRIDVLLAENNNLKLNIERLEESHKREMEKIRSNTRVIQVSDGDALLKAKLGNGDYVAASALSKVSLRIGVMMRRHPVFRMVIIAYMAALQVWVLVVLLTYTPEVH